MNGKVLSHAADKLLIGKFLWRLLTAPWVCGPESVSSVALWLKFALVGLASDPMITRDSICSNG